jgi:hypothetical protein
MWTYSQSTGELVDALGEVIGSGYSGLGADKNKPAYEAVKGEGPIPQGLWHIGTAQDHPGLGPVVMALTPDETTDPLGRSGFFIHGDSISDPGNASHGCIVLAHDIRIAVSLSPDKLLNVTT